MIANRGAAATTGPARCEQAPLCPVAEVCVDGRRVPCIDIGRAHREKLLLCDDLEQIADDLPFAVDRMACLRIASRLVPLLRECHRYEEEVVFPVFERDPALATSRARSVRRLKAEHVEDECAAQDLTEVLLAIGRGGTIDNAEALGFMLRAFFEALRRHIAFEREHVLPAVTGYQWVSDA